MNTDQVFERKFRLIETLRIHHKKTWRVAFTVIFEKTLQILYVQKPSLVELIF